MKLFEARQKTPSKWLKTKKISRTVRNSYRSGDIYDRHSGRYSQNDTYTDYMYSGYIMDKDGNEYSVEGKSIGGDSGSIAGGGRKYYVNINLGNDIIKLESYTGIMSRSTGEAIISAINDGYYLEDYLAKYKTDIDYSDRDLAASFINNGMADAKSSATDRAERKAVRTANKKEKFFQEYESLSYISGSIDEYGEWVDIKFNNKDGDEHKEIIEKFLDEYFNKVFAAPKYNYAGLRIRFDYADDAAINKYSGEIVKYDTDTFKIVNSAPGYMRIRAMLNTSTINNDLKKALIKKWKLELKGIRNKLSSYQQTLLNSIKIENKDITFDDSRMSMYNKNFNIDYLLVDFERKPLKIKKTPKSKDVEVDNAKTNTVSSSNNYPKVAYDKMAAWHNGTRKQNVGAMGDEKLRMNYNICIEMGYNKEADILRAEADKRNLILESNNIKINDKALLENLIDKYGRRFILNELKTYSY